MAIYRNKTLRLITHSFELQREATGLEQFLIENGHRAEIRSLRRTLSLKTKRVYRPSRELEACMHARADEDVKCKLSS